MPVPPWNGRASNSNNDWPRRPHRDQRRRCPRTEPRPGDNLTAHEPVSYTHLRAHETGAYL
eukprot:2363703-Pyramimonas_sp.AAC.1